MRYVHLTLRNTSLIDEIIHQKVMKMDTRWLHHYMQKTSEHKPAKWNCTVTRATAQELSVNDPMILPAAKEVGFTRPAVIVAIQLCRMADPGRCAW